MEVIANDPTAGCQIYFATYYAQYLVPGSEIAPAFAASTPLTILAFSCAWLRAALAVGLAAEGLILRALDAAQIASGHRASDKTTRRLRRGPNTGRDGKQSCTCKF
jgi:hypothetical protein